ncbi:MAG: cell division protein FtsA [Candidatus Sungbacteria bacterium]|nr:cell division protein FtsA [Candidatus Sungbacteria bacterium]
MVRTIIAALDVGSSTIQTVIAEQRRGEDALHILGVGVAPSAGVRRGVIVNIEDATAAIRQSVEEARRAAGVPVRSVWLAVGDAHIAVSSSRGVIAVSRADQEISPEDVRRAIAAAETFIPRNANKEILHIIPRDFRVDHESGVKDPVGMHGVRLEVDTLIIECSTPFLKNLLKCMEGAGLKVEDYIFSPYAAAEVALTRRQKELGVMLVDIGGSTSSFIVFEEGVPIHAGVVPIGGSHITNDVAIGFRTHVDVAEQIKLVHASCLPDGILRKEQIKLADFMSEAQATHSRRELAEIVEARLQDLFELLQKELKKIDRTRLLPAGVVLVGGSALLPGLVELTREELGLPVELGKLEHALVADENTALSLIPVLGVLEWGSRRSERSGALWSPRLSRLNTNKVAKWLKSLLP